MPNKACTSPADEHRGQALGRLPDGRAAILSSFHALSFFQLDGFAVPAPAQVRNLVYFLLDDIEHKFYNFIKENTHEKNSRFT